MKSILDARSWHAETKTPASEYIRLPPQSQGSHNNGVHREQRVMDNSKTSSIVELASATRDYG